MSKGKQDSLQAEGLQARGGQGGKQRGAGFNQGGAGEQGFELPNAGESSGVWCKTKMGERGIAIINIITIAIITIIDTNIGS